MKVFQRKHPDAALAEATVPAPHGAPHPGRRAVLRRGAALAIGAAAAAWLSGCGGGGDDAGSASGPVPPGPGPSPHPGPGPGPAPAPGPGPDPDTTPDDPADTDPFPADTTVALSFPDNFAFGPESVFVTILGSAPGSGADSGDDSAPFGFVDPRSATFTPAGTGKTFRMDAARMAFPVSSLHRRGNAWLLGVPPLQSGRVYIAFGYNFDAMPPFSAGGPVAGPENPVIFEKFELDTASNPNANVTNVDFFSVPYVLTATDRNLGAPRSLGFDTSRQDILNRFAAIPALYSDEGGDSRVFAAATVRNGRGEVVRILAPKAAGMSDWNGATMQDKVVNAQRFTHFWDRYVNEHCWRPGREFSCFGKDPKGPVYYCRVDPAGTRLLLFTDAARTRPYAIPSLPRPSAPTGLPDYMPGRGDPTLYHNCDSSTGAVDWGFLLGGNAGGPDGGSGGAGDGAYWNSDPVAIAVMVAICRGVMHLDDGCRDWTDPARFYRGRGDGIATADMPIFWYGKILHDMSADGSAYALSYDDVYGADPSIYFERTSTISVRFLPL